MKLMTMQKKMVHKLTKYLYRCREAVRGGGKKKIDYQSSSIKSLAVGCPSPYVEDGIKWFLSSTPTPTNKECVKKASFYKAFKWLDETVVEKCYPEESVLLNWVDPPDQTFAAHRAYPSRVNQSE